VYNKAETAPRSRARVKMSICQLLLLRPDVPHSWLAVLSLTSQLMYAIQGVDVVRFCPMEDSTKWTRPPEVVPPVCTSASN